MPEINVFDSVYWNAHSTVHRVIVNDQSENRTCGKVIDYEIDANSVMLQFESSELGGSINMSLRVYGEAVIPAAHFILGQLSERSILARTYVLQFHIGIIAYHPVAYLYSLFFHIEYS